MVLVKNLQVGDEIVWNGGSAVNSCAVIVREILTEQAKVRVSKPMAAEGHGLMALSFFSTSFADLQNRVTRIN